MRLHSDFQVLKRRDLIMERQISIPIVGTIPLGTTTSTTAPPATTSSTTPATTPASTTTPANTANGGTVSTTPAAPAGSTTSNTPAAPIQGTTTSAAAPAAGATTSAAVPIAGGTSAASATSAAVTPATIPASVISTIPSSLLTTQLVTAANGTVATTVLPIGAIPSINPFGSIVALNSSFTGSNVPLATLNPGTTGPGREQASTRSSNHTVEIAVPIATILGVALIGLIVALIMRRQRRNMEDQVAASSMRYNRANLIAATTGALGFGAAGAFLRNRRGEDYNETSEVGHGNEEAWYNPNRSESLSNYEQFEELSGDEGAGEAAAGGGALGAAAAAAGASREPRSSGEGGYRTASEEDADHGSFFEHNQLPEVADVSSSLGHFDGPNQDAAGTNTLSPFNNNVQGDTNRESVLSSGQAYDGAEIGENPFDLTDDGEARPNPNYDGNKIMQNPHLNSSRWSG